MKFEEIPRMSRANYHIDVSWTSIRRHFKSFDVPIVLDPEYQRGYVWTKQQQIDYLEFRLKGGMSGGDLFWNSPGWHEGASTYLELVDGKQRLEAVLDFLAGNVPVFGRKIYEFEDELNPVRHRFKFHINDLDDPIKVVQWYLDMNTGGSIHTEKDLQSAYDVLEKLKAGYCDDN